MSTDGSHPRERGVENLITHRSVAFVAEFPPYFRACARPYII